MERYVVDNAKERLFRNFFQTGGDMDGYIYTQEGEGIGSFFGNLFNKVLPLATKAIKGAAGIAKPFAKQALTEIAQEAGKEVIKTLAPNRKKYTPRNKGSENPKKRARRFR